MQGGREATLGKDIWKQCLVVMEGGYSMIRQTPFYDLFSAFDALDQATSIPMRSRNKSRMPRVSSVSHSAMPMDLYETTDHAVVLASLPGMHPDDVNVLIEEDTLTISGSISGDRKQQDEHGDPVTWYMAEIPRGSYERRIQLPFKIEESQVQAEFANGLLRIKLPKLEASRPRRIPVQVLEKRFAEITAESSETDTDQPAAD